MSEEKNANQDEFAKLLEKDDINVPQVGDIVKGVVVSASNAEVRIDVDGILMGVVRGPELYFEDDVFAGLKPGDEVEATVVDEENENGELELSFRQVGQEKAWQALKTAFKEKEQIKVRVIDANKGGLLCRFRQIAGFLPVSQLAPENYPRINGGDKSKILEKLRSFVSQELEVNVMTLDESDDKIIFSEKDVWSKKQKHILEKYKVGMVVEGKITAITNFGVFVNFDENMEGLIHISELAWQRIDSLSDMYKVGDIIKAEIVSIDGAKIFLSAKKLINDPWKDVEERYQIGQNVKGEILKVNPFGLFVKLDENIHGLAHVSQLVLGPKEKISDIFKSGEEKEFEIISISAQEHRLALKLAGTKKKAAKENDKNEEENENENEDDKDEKNVKEKKKKKE
ncbi:MAG: S1 RNA-binding domain-containing protein [Planctomycetes bacterium]|nr:S1 RNA-binding domain-containing protein [Planctomycetota bacterium]